MNDVQQNPADDDTRRNLRPERPRNGHDDNAIRRLTASEMMMPNAVPSETPSTNTQNGLFTYRVLPSMAPNVVRRMLSSESPAAFTPCGLASRSAMMTPDSASVAMPQNPRIRFLPQMNKCVGCGLAVGFGDGPLGLVDVWSFFPGAFSLFGGMNNF